MTYTYECNKCGRFEIEKSIHDKELALCKCGNKVKRIFASTTTIWNTGGACGKVGK